MFTLAHTAIPTSTPIDVTLEELEFTAEPSFQKGVRGFGIRRKRANAKGETIICEFIIATTGLPEGYPDPTIFIAVPEDRFELCWSCTIMRGVSTDPHRVISSTMDCLIIRGRLPNYLDSIVDETRFTQQERDLLMQIERALSGDRGSYAIDAQFTGTTVLALLKLFLFCT